MKKTYLVVVKLINSSNLIKAGMSADVYFDVEDKTKSSFVFSSCKFSFK